MCRAAVFSKMIVAALAGLLLMAVARGGFWNAVPAWLPPTLVIQGTLDPKTPYAGAEAHVARLLAAGAQRA